MATRTRHARLPGMLMSGSALRLAVAALLVAVLWLAVAWALAGSAA